MTQAWRIRQVFIKRYVCVCAPSICNPTLTTSNEEKLVAKLSHFDQKGWALIGDFLTAFVLLPLFFVRNTKGLVNQRSWISWWHRLLTRQRGLRSRILMSYCAQNANQISQVFISLHHLRREISFIFFIHTPFMNLGVTHTHTYFLRISNESLFIQTSRQQSCSVDILYSINCSIVPPGGQLSECTRLFQLCPEFSVCFSRLKLEVCILCVFCV